ncbi:hypothetical protein LTS10_004601 [Elasticomyces elasticus]|nr:hypothetical protein LTS10_004601 [Elasticomyces elasticus]
MNATPSDLSESAFQQALANPAFDPQPGFDFVEANDAVLRGMHDSDAAALDMLNHEAHSRSSLNITAHSWLDLPSCESRLSNVLKATLTFWSADLQAAGALAE